MWTCEECLSIDPAPVHWEKGKLEVEGNWQKLGMDITHYGAHHYFDTNRPWPIALLNLEAVGKTRFSDHDLPVGGSVL